MNIIVKQIELLKNIEPETIANYLHAKGWQKQQHIENRATIWTQTDLNSQSFPLVLPLNPEVPDFPVTLDLLIENLAKIEGRSQLEIIEEVITNIPNLKIQALISQIQSPQDSLMR